MEYYIMTAMMIILLSKVDHAWSLLSLEPFRCAVWALVFIGI